ncbi:hypothetical protein [Comamonas thiooxydans]|uniref:hypothetical protein n=1 Tax=Comamonas thiooxydans TaxID=363952 RepID=UPI001551A2FC|nr:hypothetical protein [Comamonas thiooxydans]
MKSIESIAKAAYEAFRASLTPVPVVTWNEMTEPVRQAWIVAAQTMADEIRQVH